MNYENENYVIMKSLSQYKKEFPNETRLLWHSDYWDGPLTGLMLWNGEKVWFNFIGERHEYIDLDPIERQELIDYYVGRNLKYQEQHIKDLIRHFQYTVHRLDPEVLAEVEEQHKLFTEYVGTHCDYDIDGKRPIGIGVKSHTNHHLFYDNKKCIDMKLTESNKIGEFER